MENRPPFSVMTPDTAGVYVLIRALQRNKNSAGRSQKSIKSSLENRSARGAYTAAQRPSRLARKPGKCYTALQRFGERCWGLVEREKWKQQ